MRIYKNYEIIKSRSKRQGENYFTLNLDNDKPSPEYYRTISLAKEAIDSGEADLTTVELEAKSLLQEFECGNITKTMLEEMAWDGKQSAIIALTQIN